MSNKEHISLISSILKKKGIEKVVICPGSRNAPLTMAFYSVLKESCISIVDERCAGYFALGLSLKSQIPVVIITTSGTAVVNLYPAIAEAYHQGVPLIVITADRPKEWIDQQDNQTIRQDNVFERNCKASYELPVEATSEDDIWYTQRVVNEAYNISVKDKSGPVHVNVPLREPLYSGFTKGLEGRTIDFASANNYQFDEKQQKVLSLAKRVLIVCGQRQPSSRLSEMLTKVSEQKSAVILGEHISNVSGNNVIYNANSILQGEFILDEITPDLVIYFGGQIVSRQLKGFLRELENVPFWNISPAGEHTDTFRNLTQVINVEEDVFFEGFLKIKKDNRDIGFITAWANLSLKTEEMVKQLTEGLAFSDLLIFKELSQRVNIKDIVFVGNSAPIRYFQLFPCNANSVYANRGTSGIDGCVSTAAGIASVEEQTVIAIVGDMSFVYDSNGLWNRNMPANLKIVVINNYGGGIFSLIDGPSKQAGFKEFFEAYHPVSLESLSRAYCIQHFKCAGLDTLDESYAAFYNSKGTAILEIETNPDINTQIFNNFVKNLKNYE